MKPRYFDRGIEVCTRWLEFVNFKEDMGPRPEGLVLGRVDVHRSFDKDNCRWMGWDEVDKSGGLR